MATINDIKLKLWLRARNSGKLVWRTKENKEIPIKDLDDKYLHNILNMLENQEEKEEEELEALASVGDAPFFV